MPGETPCALTTFSPEYYERWGREGLASMVKYWPGKIVAYYEHERPEEFHDRVEFRDLFAQSEAMHFIKWTSMVPLLKGILPNGEYSYHHNANKFGRKVFVITDYAMEGRPFFFLGADTRCTKPVPAEFINGLIENRPGVFLLRRHLDAHVESDFAGYDPRDKRMGNLLKVYRAMFINGAFLELKDWHDCLALDTLLDTFKLTQEVNNLSDGVIGEGKRGLHVWPNTVLAEYMIHLKGMAKDGKVAA